MKDPPLAGTPLSPSHERLIRLLAEAYVDQFFEELEKRDSASNATEKAQGESRDV